MRGREGGGGSAGVQTEREMSLSKERWKDHGERGMAWRRRSGNMSGKAHAGVEMHFM